MRDTADAQLQRILYTLPAAARETGVRFAELEEALGVSANQIVRDIAQVTDRAFYHAAGESNETQILIEAEGIQMLARGEFRRPPRLTTTEAFALGVGLRSLACECQDHPARQARLTDLATRLERDLATASPLGAGDILLDSGLDPEGIRTVLRDATRDQRACRIRYLKPGDETPAERVIHPYAMVYAERWWYVMGHCVEKRDLRRFRLDRILRAELLEDGFAPPAHFEPRSQVTSGKMFVAPETSDVRVRYSPRIAAWIREREPQAVPQEDGSAIVVHQVADPQWLIGHVLQYAAEAEILDPPEYRELMVETVARLLPEA